jgi:hypothetical protein
MMKNFKIPTIITMIIWLSMATTSANAGIKSAFSKVGSATKTVAVKIVDGGQAVVKAPVHFVRRAF